MCLAFWCILKSCDVRPCYANNPDYSVVAEGELGLFSEQTFQYANEDGERLTRKYRLFIPASAESASDHEHQWPLLVWLHGQGEWGDDNRAHIRWLGFLFDGYKDRRQFPCFVMALQCPYGDIWNERQLDQAKSIVDQLKQELAIDSQRIYVSGVSSGGDGTWAMMFRYPGLFAAGVPMASGGSSAADLTPLRSIPIWAFHTRADDGTPVDGVRNTVARLAAIRGNVHLTETSGYIHDCWTVAFTEFHVTDWLLAQEKGVDGPIPVASRFANSARLATQHLASLVVVRFYLALPVAAVVCWWLARRHLRQIRRQRTNVVDPLQATASTEATLGT